MKPRWVRRNTTHHTCGAALLLGLGLLLAAPDRAAAAAGEACRDQAAIAERAAGIPEGLLLAIGKRESGRFDPGAGGTLPWPWAVNREGQGRLFESRQEALAYVASAQREGSRSIDIGCFQINLKYHPMAFPSLEEAFEPARNAAYAAHFLTQLHDRDGSWELAVADYHSASPLLGVPYREAVFAAWRGVSAVARFRGPSPESSRVVMGIHIWTPGMIVASDVGTRPVAMHSPANLPRVFTPGGSVAGPRTRG